MRGHRSLIIVAGIIALLEFPSATDALLPTDPASTLSTYVPAKQSELSSIASHCEGCKVRVPEKQPAKVGSRGFHRPSRHSTSNYKTVRSGKYLKLKPPGSRTKRHATPASLPRRALSRLGLQAQHFESWQVQAVDGDTIRYGTERIRLRGLNAPELSEPGGLEAQRRLAELLREGTINIVPHGKDVYGRMLADVFISDRNLAEIMTSEGFAKRR